MTPEQIFSGRELARNDLYFFARWMFLRNRKYRWIRGDHHKQICDALMKVYRGETKRLIINIPPRYSKTELAVKCFIAWTLGHHPDSEYIHTSYGATLAENNSMDVREMIASEEYRAIFPKTVLLTEKVSNWKTTAGGTLYSTGSMGGVTGFGAGKHRPGFSGAIIIDDPLKADEALSDTIRAKVNNWFQNTLESRKNSRDTPIILIMQRLHEDDLAGWLLNGGNGEKWEHLCIPAIKPDGTALWPEKHTIEELRRMEASAPYVFAGQYMQNPAPLDGGIFKPGKIEIIDALPAENIQWVRGWDLAASADGDYTAGVKIGRSQSGKFIIADIIRERMNPGDSDALIYNTANADGRRTLISIPQDPGQAGKKQAFYFVQKLAGYRVITSPESGPKTTRAFPVASQINVGNVSMLRSSWNIPFVEEMRMFPNGRHDDMIDALSRAFGEITEMKRPLNIRI